MVFASAGLGAWPWPPLARPPLTGTPWPEAIRGSRKLRAPAGVGLLDGQGLRCGFVQKGLGEQKHPAIGQRSRVRHLPRWVIAYLIEIDRRQLFARDGYSSLFKYCTDKLGMSEDVAGTRIAGARLAARFPVVLDMLADGRLYLSGLRLLKPHLDAANHTEILAAADSKSKRDIELLIAKRFAKPDAAASVRKLPAPKPPALEASDLFASGDEPVDTQATPQSPVSDEAAYGEQDRELPGRAGARVPDAAAAESAEDAAAAPPRLSLGEPAATPMSPARASRPAAHPAPAPEPLSASRYKVTFTASKELVGKLEHAQALLSHVVRSGDLEEVFDRALTMLIEAEEKRRFGARRQRRKASARKGNAKTKPASGVVSETDRAAGATCDSSDTTYAGASTMPTDTASPASPASIDAPSQSEAPPKAPSRHIPAAIRREVYERDDRRCTYRGPDGRRCNETHNLEFDHIEPWGRGGETSVANIELRCQIHNVYRARQCYGSEYVDEITLRSSPSSDRTMSRRVSSMTLLARATT